MGRFAWVILIGVAILGIAIWFILEPGVLDGATLARIRFKQAECRSVRDRQLALGIWKSIVPSVGGLDVQVNPQHWNLLATEQQLADAFTVFCAAMPANGKLTVTFRDPEGSAVFRLVNGQVAPWW